MTMLTVLIAGFGRFHGAPVNPSGPLAMRLAGRHRPALAGTRRIGHVFATRYADVDRALPQLLACERPDVIVLFGVAGRTRHLRIEQIARNRVSVLFPDAGRNRPQAPTISSGVAARRNPLALQRLVMAARSANVPARISRNAGSYLCNYAYWRALEAVESARGPRLAIFVHVPQLRGKTKRRSLGARYTGRRLTLSDFVRAGEAILVTVIALGRQSSVRGRSMSEASPRVALLV